MSKAVKYVVTSGMAFLTENNGTTISNSDAKRFDSYGEAYLALLESNVDFEYWHVKEI